MAAEEGFEPSQTESESAVLPLHHSAINAFTFYQYLFRMSIFKFKLFQSIKLLKSLIFIKPYGT